MNVFRSALRLAVGGITAVQNKKPPPPRLRLPSLCFGYPLLKSGYMVFVLLRRLLSAVIHQGCPLRSLTPLRCALALMPSSIVPTFVLSRGYSVCFASPAPCTLRPRCAGSVRAIFFYSPVASLSADFHRLPSGV